MKTECNALNLKRLKKGVLFLMGILFIQCSKNNVNQDIVLLELPTNKVISPGTNQIHFKRKETFVKNASTTLIKHKSNGKNTQLNYELHGHLSHVKYERR